MAHIPTPARLSPATSTYLVGECPHCREGIEATVSVSVVIDAIDRAGDHLELKTTPEMLGIRVNHSCGSLAEQGPRGPFMTNGEIDANRVHRL